MTTASRWKKPLRAGGGLVLFVALAYPLVLWTEAEKEIRVLCSMLPPGTQETEVIRTLNTGNLLTYGPPEETGQNRRSPRSDVQGWGVSESTDLRVASPWMLGTLECRLSMEGGVVTANSCESSFRLSRAGAWVAAAGFLSLVVLQLLLALGAPLGRLAWRGRHRVLPPLQRLTSLLFAAFLALGILSVLQKGGVAAPLPWASAVETYPWILALVFLLRFLWNALSENLWARRLGTPLALLLSLACVVVGLGM